MASTPVQKELGKIAADFRRYKILRGLAVCWIGLACAAALLLIAYWATGIVVPYAVPSLLALALVAAVIIFSRNSRSIIGIREIARQVEKDDPKLNTLLLAAAEQEPDPATGGLNFLQVRVIREALDANRKSPWSRRFNERLFWVQSAHLGTLCVCALALMSLAFIVPAKLTFTAGDSGTGLEITPGNISVEKGTALAIVAKFRGRAPGEVQLIYKTASGAEQSLPMARSLSDPLFGVTLPSVLENTAYRIEYGGEKSDTFAATVFEFPELKRADADLNFPEYTARAPEKVEDTRRVTAVEGTDVQFTFYLNKGVRTARLLGTNNTAIALTNAAPHAVRYTTGFPLLESGAYKLELVDEDGRTNKMAPDFVFVALPNQQPKLRFQTPRGDQRVSALQEVRFDGSAQDDFGLLDYGLAYTMAGSKTEFLSLSSATNKVRGMISQPHQTNHFSWMLALEKLAAEPGQLVSYYLWADDLGPDGQPRRTESDMFFAEVRPFEEIFRQGNSDRSNSSQQQQQGQGTSPATELLDLQKEIITATWNLRRRENISRPSAVFKKDVQVVHESQESAIEKAEEAAQEIRDDKMLALVTTAVSAMESASEILGTAETKNTPEPLPKALEFEQAAYQALLKLQAREYQVNRNQSQASQGQNRGQQRAQQQLDQLELKEDENRYETESEASPLQNQEQREALQVLNRLKELARRQQDMSERLKELQSALNEAKTQQEKEKLERELKRLQEEQHQIVQDTDELRQRMSQPENQSRMAEAREQLDQTRQQSREAAQQLEQGEVGKALSSSSRAQQQLQQLSDQFRKSTSNQFTEEMRQMRQQARDLEKKHTELAEKLDEAPPQTRRALSEEGPKKQMLDVLAQERSALTNLLKNLRTVTEQAEAAEPLLSRQLYDTLRKTAQGNPEKALDYTQRAMERDFTAEARQAHDSVEQTLKDLKEGVERAAENVLGDEAESLRFAENEIRNLADRVEQEMERARAAAGSTNGGTNLLASLSREYSTNTLSALLDAASTNRSGRRGAGGQELPEGQPLPGGEGAQQGAQGQQAARNAGEPSSNPQNGGSQAGGQSQQAQQAQRPEGQEPSSGSQPGQGGEQRQGQGERPAQGEGQPGGQGGRPSGQEALAQNSQNPPSPGNRNSPGQAGQRPGGVQYDPLSANRGGTRGGARVGPGGGLEEPLTGRDFTRWSDRLRDVEEVLQAPDLRLDVARIREQARLWRAEQKRHSSEPEWNVLENSVINPLRIVQKRVGEELARHNSREAVVPVDRDPVPQKYSDLVSRYYERLGGN